MGNKAKRYGRRSKAVVNPLKLSLFNKAFNERMRKRRESDTRESKKVNNKCSSSGTDNSAGIIGSSSVSSSEESEIIRQSENNKKMKMDNNWKPMAKCSEGNVGSSSLSNSEEHKIIGQSEKNMKMKMGNNWKPMAKCSEGNAKYSEGNVGSSSLSNSEENEIIRQSKKMKMDNNWKPMAKCSEENIGSSSLSNSEEHKIIGQSEMNMKMMMGNNWKPMAKCSNDKKVLGSSSIFDHYRIMREILSRLPVKSLMRFKCVSKHWNFSICQDQGLIDLHFTRSKQHGPDLFLVVPRHTVNLLGRYTGSRITRRYAGVREYKYRESFLLGNIFKSGTSPAIRTTVRKLERKPFHYTGILAPVNGLICFVNRRLAVVCILNPSTRESTPWIASSLRQNEKYNFIADYSCGVWLPTYFLGFDPATKQHKVLCTWRVRGPVTRNSNVVTIGKDIQWADFCEVLTVGENTWRYIDEKVPFSYTVKFSVYANGYIYWGKQSIGIPEILNAFDVGQEKFKVIQVPQEIRDKCKNPPGGDTFGPFDSLTDVGGHIALLQRWSDKVVKLWICGDDTSTGSYSKWTEITMK